MKGIVLARDSETRLYPLTKVTSKQLVWDKLVLSAAIRLLDIVGWVSRTTLINHTHGLGVGTMHNPVNYGEDRKKEGDTMINALSAAKYIASVYQNTFGEAITEMELHKLLYFAQR